MNLRGTLFVKTFIGFWLATLAILGSWLIAAEYFESKELRISPPQEPGMDVPPPRFLLSLNYALEGLDTEGLAGLVEETESKHGVKVWLLTRSGREMLDRDAPEHAVQLAQELRGRPRLALGEHGGERLYAHDIYNNKIGHFRAVVAVPRPRSPLLRALGDNPWLRVALAVVISGLICFGLSRLMTSRIRQLQAASRHLAQGDLDTRIDVRATGGDETDALARDFNSMAAQLQERIQAQKRLLADVSHELRSPLARLRVALALAEKNTDSGSEYLLRIEREAERLEELIAQLLATQRSGIIMDSHLDLVPLLDQLCVDARFEAQASQVGVEFRNQLEQAVVASSGDLLLKSFENLLRNALAHAPVGSTVQVNLDSAADHYCVEVRDAGPGVPDEDLEQIFDSFFRVDSARPRETGGYGLGLSIAKRAIEQHDGSIIATNLHPGLAVRVELQAFRD